MFNRNFDLKARYLFAAMRGYWHQQPGMEDTDYSRSISEPSLMPRWLYITRWLWENTVTLGQYLNLKIWGPDTGGWPRVLDQPGLQSEILSQKYTSNNSDPNHSLVIKLLQKVAIYAKYLSLFVVQIIYFVIVSSMVSSISGVSFLLVKM